MWRRLFAELQAGLPPRVKAAATVLSLLIAAHGAATFTGPYRWLADWDQRVFGHYSPELCFVLAWFALGLLMLGALQLARRLGVLRFEPAAPRPPLDVEPAMKAMRKWQLWLTLFGGSAVVLFVGARDLYSVRGEVALESIGAQRLAAGQSPHSHYVRLDGELLSDAALEAKDNETALFIPLVYAGWSPARPIPAVLRIRERDVERFDREGAHGMEWHDGLHTPVKRLWQERGLDASRAFVLDFGVTPDDRITKGKWTLGIGAIGLIGTLCAFLLARRRTLSLA